MGFGLGAIGIGVSILGGIAGYSSARKARKESAALRELQIKEAWTSYYRQRADLGYNQYQQSIVRAAADTDAAQDIDAQQALEATSGGARGVGGASVEMAYEQFNIAQDQRRARLALQTQFDDAAFAQELTRIAAERDARIAGMPAQSSVDPTPYILSTAADVLRGVSSLGPGESNSSGFSAQSSGGVPLPAYDRVDTGFTDLSGVPT